MLAAACFVAAGTANAKSEQALGATFQTTRLSVDHGTVYTFQSPGVAYLWQVGGAWTFAGGLNLSFPVGAAMDGQAVSVHDVYGFAFGLDLGAGVDRWFVLSPRLELGVGPRLHGLYTALQARPAYRTFQSATLGLGLAGELAYSVHRTLFGAPVVVGAFLESNVDFIDALHGDRLDYGLSLLAGASAGVRW